MPRGRLGSDSSRRRLPPYFIPLGGVFLIDSVTRALSQGLTLVLARLLHPAQFGIFTIAITVVGYAVLLTDGGTGEAAVQQLTGKKNPGTRFLGDWQPGRRKLAALVTFGFASLAFLPDGLVSSLQVISIIGISVLGQIELQGRFIAARVEESFQRGAIYLGTLAVAGSAGAVLLSIYRPSAIWAATGFTVVISLVALADYTSRGAPASSPHALRTLRHKGAPFLTVAMAVSLYTRADRLFVAFFRGEREAGYYSAAYALCIGVSLLGGAAQVVLFPRSQRELQDRVRLRALLRRPLLFALVGVVIGTLLYFARDPAVTVLYGTEYRPAASLVAVLVWTVPLYLMNPLLANYVVALGRQRTLARVAIVNLVIGLVGYTFLTMVAGGKGAAVTSVLVELSGTLQMLFVIWKHLPSEA